MPMKKRQTNLFFNRLLCAASVPIFSSSLSSTFGSFTSSRTATITRVTAVNTQYSETQGMEAGTTLARALTTALGRSPAFRCSTR